MNIKRAIFTLMPLIAIYNAQSIDISGIVKNSGGSGIEGVKVRLGKAAIMTTTGADGSFTLKDNAGVGAKRQPHYATSGKDCRFLLEDNKLFINRAEQAEVKVMVYDCNGKLLVSNGKVVSGENASIPLPHFGSGIHLYRVSVNNELFTFKSVTGIAPNRAPASLWKGSGPAKQAKAAARIDDALLFIKEGYTLSRIAVTKPDTSGLQITMAPLDTGTVTDTDGNAYRTVKIGNQEWMASNLRTTKFNDGSNIGSGCHFYTNVTDAAAKKKWGALYTQAAVKSGKLAPKGWHLPTNADWDTLKNYLISHGYNYDGTTSEDKIAKSMATTTDWQTSTEPGGIGWELSFNNASGFSALPAGWRYWGTNQFEQQKLRAYWWSATQHDGTYTCVYDLWYINFNLDMTWNTLVECSVRLVRDN
jgi:uncharacterized protein (TIGR02145 family)